jgi:hypothetical protein
MSKDVVRVSKASLAYNVVNGLVNILMCCIISTIIYEGNQVSLIQTDDNGIEFRNSKESFGESSSDSEEAAEVLDSDEEEWINDHDSRARDWERKLDQ